jgi:hypothetical protein
MSQPPEFWAYVRLVSQSAGYTRRGTHSVKAINLEEIVEALEKANVTPRHVLNKDGKCMPFGDLLLEYFDYRARVLNKFVEPRLMDVDDARRVFESLKDQLRPACPLPMNKQKGDKRAPAYFTGIINMLIEANAAGLTCDYDPRSLTIVTRNGLLIRTLARRLDGAFTGPIDPVAVWEIKEYYYTTTFGSRVADAIYESQLDGMELTELRKAEGIQIDHYLFVDSHFSWWGQGKSYLCRIIDLLNMGFVDEVLFGAEVVQRLPQLVKKWVQRASSLTAFPNQ